MAGKRKHEGGTGSVAPKKKKRLAEEVGLEVKLEAKYGEEGEYPRGDTSILTPADVREAREGADGEFEKRKEKKSGKKRGEGKKGLDILDSRPISDAELHKKKKKEKKQRVDTPLSPRLDHLNSVEDDGPLRGAQTQKKTKTKEVTPITVALDSSQIVKDGQRKEKKKKKKTKIEVTPTLLSLDSTQILKDCLGSGAESHWKEKKRKFTTMLPALDPLQTIEDWGPATGSVKKNILKPQKPRAGNGAESDTKKKVTFQLPDRAEDEPSENELLGDETEFTDVESLTWETDKLRPGLVYGMYSAEEDKLLKQAIFDYIQEQGWDPQEGLEKILNSGKSEARGCWHVIRKCLPQRELKRLYTRAHRILGPNTLLGKWTNEEIQSLTELHSVHGNNWKRIGTIIGRDPQACKDKWRYIKFSISKEYKTGVWSEGEQQKLCELVLKCLHVKKKMAEKGLLKKDHRLVRDDINWEFIAEQMDGRGRLDCLTQWYRKMASPMVTTREWSNGDDQRLLERLMEEFPLSEELVEWDLLLDNRSGEPCKKRWEQMQRTLGRGPEVRHQHFLEKLESIMKRFAPYLLDTEYDQKFAEDMQRADADEPEDEDM